MGISASTTIAFRKAGESAVQLLARPAAVVYQQGVAATYDVEWVLADGGSEQPAAGYTIPTLDDGSQLKTGAATQGLRFSVPANGTMRLHVLASCAYKGCVSTTYSYNGKTYAGKVSVAPAAKGDPGQPGQPGSVGATVRTLDWDAIPKDGTFDIYSGAEGEPYLDVVFYGSAKYMCRLSYRPAASSPTPQDDATHYEMAASWGFIAARLLMAEYSAIDLMQTNGLRVFDADGALAGGVAGGTGAGAVLYVNPMRRPVACHAMYYATTSALAATAALPDSATLLGGQAPGTPRAVSVPAKSRLHVEFQPVYSDGSRDAFLVRNAYYNSGSSAATLRMSADFAAMAEGEAPPQAESALVPTSLPSPPATDGAKPVLWARPRWQAQGSATWSAGAWSSVAQVSQGLNPNEAMAQLRRDGSAMFGSYGGRRVELDPAEGSVAIYAADGSLSAVIDGDEIASASDLFGAGTASSQVVSIDKTASAQAGGSATVGLASFSSLSSGAVVSVSNAAAEVSLSAAAEPQGMHAQCPSARVSLLIGGKVAAAYTVLGSWGNASSAALDFSGASAMARAGGCKVELRVEAGGAAATATMAAGMTARAAYSNRLCRLFANGLAVGSSTDNYLLALCGEGGLAFEARRGAKGIGLDGGGAYYYAANGTKTYFDNQ